MRGYTEQKLRNFLKLYWINLNWYTAIRYRISIPTSNLISLENSKISEELLECVILSYDNSLIHYVQHKLYSTVYSRLYRSNKELKDYLREWKKNTIYFPNKIKHVNNLIINFFNKVKLRCI